MTKSIKLLLVITLIVLTLIFVACKPIIFYLERTYKAYGNVTDASSGAPLGSVEVFVSPYQYSELTNSLGDYEIELSEGTWLLDFIKDGYEVATVEVTVNDENRRVEVNVALIPKPPEVVGTWLMDGTFLYYEEPPDQFFNNTLYQTMILYPDLSFEMSGTSQADGGPPVEQWGSGTYEVDEEAGTMVITFTEFYYGGEPGELPPQNVEYQIEGDVLTLTWPEALPYSPAEPLVCTRQ